jgi:hypothetical protein
VSAKSNVRRLAVAPDPEGLTSSRVGIVPATEAHPSCSLCFGTGMEVVMVKGARRCHCHTRDTQTKLLEAARIPHRYGECSLSNYRPANPATTLHWWKRVLRTCGTIALSRKSIARMCHRYDMRQSSAHSVTTRCA